MLTQIRHQCLSKLIYDVRKRQSKLPGNKAKLEIGQLVIRQLRPAEVVGRQSLMKAVKVAMKWSEPHRIISFKNADRTVLRIKSIWRDTNMVEVNVSQILPIPTNLPVDLQNVMKWEMMAELRRHTGSNKKLKRKAMGEDNTRHDEEKGDRTSTIPVPAETIREDLLEGSVAAGLDEDRSSEAAVPRRKRVRAVIQCLWMMRQRDEDPPYQKGGSVMESIPYKSNG